MLEDPNFVELAEWLGASGARSVLAPAGLHRALSGTSKIDRLLSYLACSEELSGIDAVVIHKGFLDRLDPAVVLICCSRWTLSFANPVYCVFTMKGLTPVAPEIRISHIGPIESWLRHWHEIRSGSGTGAAFSALVVSAFEVGNIGDDLVSLAAGRMLEAAGASNVNFSGPIASCAMIERSDLVVMGGGGLLYDLDSENLENYLWPLLAAQRLGKGNAILGIGTQGIETPAGRAATRRALLETGLISARSQGDVDVLADIAPEIASRIQLSTDLGFFMADELRAQALRFDTDTPTAILALSSTTLGLTEGAEAMAAVHDQLIPELRNRGYLPILALHSQDDLEMYIEISKKNAAVPIINLVDVGPLASSSVFANADVVITSRFHGVVFGAIFEKPIITVYRGDCKIRRMVQGDLNSLQGQAISSTDLTAAAILALLSGARAPDRKQVAQCEQRARDLVGQLGAYLHTLRAQL